MAMQEVEMGAPDDGAAYRHWKTWDDDAFGRCDPVEARYFDCEFARAGVAIERGTHVVEIGFGNGGFAAWANARECDYTGTELDPELIQRARQCGWRAFPATLALGELELPATPDCIVLLDVMEHLDIAGVVALLGSAARVLRAGGTVIARLPSGDSPFARPIQHGDITHRAILGSSAIRQLAAQAGLEVVQIRAPVLPLRGVGVRRWLRRAPLLAGRALASALVRTLFHDGQPTVIAANMVVVLRTPPGRAP